MEGEEGGEEMHAGGGQEDGDEATSSAASPAPKRLKGQRGTTGEEKASGDAASSAPPSAHRFIVFVGNLPYRVKKEDVEGLFKSMHVTGIRMPTDKQSTDTHHTHNTHNSDNTRPFLQPAMTTPLSAPS